VNKILPSCSRTCCSIVCTRIFKSLFSLVKPVVSLCIIQIINYILVEIAKGDKFSENLNYISSIYNLCATLPRYAREGAYPISDTYPIRIRIGYVVDTYPWSIGKKINKTKFRYVEDTYPIQQTSNLGCGYAQPRTEWRPCNTKGSRRRVLCGQGCSPARVLASAAEPPSIQAPPPPIEAPRTSAFADWSSTTAGFDLRRRRFDVRNRRIDLCCRRFELRGCRIDAPTLRAEVACHGAEGGRGCGRWSRWGWVAGSGSSCAPTRELNWTWMGWQSIGQGTGTHMVLRWAVGFPKTMVVRPALLLFYFLNSKRIRVSDCLGNCRIRVSVSFRYRYTYPYPCNIAHRNHFLVFFH
jgi:hypothetical protein